MAIKGDITIAIQRIQILIINIIPTTINGIAIAIECHSDSTITSNLSNTHQAFTIIHCHAFIKDEYNIEKTQT